MPWCKAVSSALLLGFNIGFSGSLTRSRSVICCKCQSARGAADLRARPLDADQNPGRPDWLFWAGR